MHYLWMTRVDEDFHLKHLNKQDKKQNNNNKWITSIIKAHTNNQHNNYINKVCTQNNKINKNAKNMQHKCGVFVKNQLTHEVIVIIIS